MENLSSGVENVTNNTMTVTRNGATINVNGADAAAIALYSMNGSMVRFINNTNEIDVDGLNGLYIIVVADKNGETHTEKIVIR